MENDKTNNKRNFAEKPDYPFAVLREGSDFKGNKSKFYHIPDEDTVIRKSFVNVHGEGSEKMDIHERAEYLQEQVNEFKKIVGEYGIRMAKTDYVIGTDPEENRPAIFGVTERIEGENLEKMAVLDKETAEKVDDLYAKLIACFTESYLKNFYFWFDPKNEQFVFGKAQRDEKPDIYLVDVDPNIVKWDNQELQKELKVKGKKELFWRKMNWLRTEMSDMERKVNEKGFTFTRAREALEKAKMEIPNT
ncbi:MAG: hypothetical protein WC878_04980 [Candidatus Paceibacterota bacterium]|jgi:hypothetical protein